MYHRPIIAITGPKKGGIARFFISLAVLLCGGKPKLFLEDKKVSGEFDGLIISGGDDLDHALYESEFCDLDDIISSKRDALEYGLLHKAYVQNRPVLGICRGYQLINVYFGGSLHKDITLHYGKIKYSIFPWKKVSVAKNSLLFTATKDTTLAINTLHHQAIKHIPTRFTISSVDKLNMIQAIEHRFKPIWGVQWHPEYLIYRPKQLAIFKKLITLSKRF